MQLRAWLLQESNKGHVVYLEIRWLRPHIPFCAWNVIRKARVLEANLQIIKGVLRDVDCEWYWSCHAFLTASYRQDWPMSTLNGPDHWVRL